VAQRHQRVAVTRLDAQRAQRFDQAGTFSNALCEVVCADLLGQLRKPVGGADRCVPKWFDLAAEPTDRVVGVGQAFGTEHGGGAADPDVDRHRLARGHALQQVVVADDRRVV